MTGVLVPKLILHDSTHLVASPTFFHLAINISITHEVLFASGEGRQKWRLWFRCPDVRRDGSIRNIEALRGVIRGKHEQEGKKQFLVVLGRQCLHRNLRVKVVVTEDVV